MSTDDLILLLKNDRTMNYKAYIKLKSLWVDGDNVIFCPRLPSVIGAVAPHVEQDVKRTGFLRHP